MIEIDGSEGEGGGQVLRTALGLSALTKQEFRIFNIRAKRSNPGLRPQHLHAVKAVQEACNARVSGAEIKSQEIAFSPGDLSSKKIRVNIGTAGSTTLILQALMIPATQVELEAEITGGTDNPFAPPVDYLINVTLPLLSKLGYDAQVELVRRGHYPKGGGRIRFWSNSFQPEELDLEERGELKRVWGLAHVTRLPEHIVERELKAAKTILLNNNVLSIKLDKEMSENGSTGTGIVLWAECENSVLGSSSLGKPGKRAELVGKEAAERLLSELDSGMVLDSHMSDQIIPYLGLCGGSVTVSEVTQHALTCARVCNLFLDSEIKVKGEVGEPGRLIA